jgi:type II secretory pathway component GspD/PulD (secretin)
MVKTRINWNMILVGLVLFLCSSGIAQGTDEPLVNLLFFETNLREALSEITMQTGVNIIPDSSVTGTVTADFRDVPLEKALRMLVIGGGFTFRKIDDFYLVGLPDPRNTAFNELVETKLITLNNVTADQVISTLPSFLANYVRGAAHSRLITIYAPPGQIERIEALIQGIDQPKKQVEIGVVIVEVSSLGLKELGSKKMEYEFSADQKKKKEWDAEIGYLENLLLFRTNVFGNLLPRGLVLGRVTLWWQKVTL